MKTETFFGYSLEEAKKEKAEWLRSHKVTVTKELERPMSSEPHGRYTKAVYNSVAITIEYED
jgi:hypothetical protein